MIPLHRFIIRPKPEFYNPDAAHLLNAAHKLGFQELTGICAATLYVIQGHLSHDDCTRLAAQLLCDPISEAYTHEQSDSSHNQTSNQRYATVEMLLKPGITDPKAQHIKQMAARLGITHVELVFSGRQIKIESQTPLSSETLHLLAKRLWVNPVIHYYSLGPIHTLPVTQTQLTDEPVKTFNIRELDETGLLALSQERRTALNLSEMLAVQSYYRQIERDMRDIELETIAQTWSEHCSHKTFKATIHNEHEQVDGLLNTYIRAATNKIDSLAVVSAFVDNAGIISFDDEYDVAFKVETHNHPSALEPFGGANTGVGGVIRDILGVSAKPIAITNVLCFGPQDAPLNQLPEGTLHPYFVQEGVVSGIEDYGNKTGIPTVNGAVVYHEGYTSNPLVFCGCVGIIPKGSHPVNPQIHDRIIVLGGKTGRDGLRGATFSSMPMDSQTGEVASSCVQIGDPIVAKGLIEVITRAQEAKLYNAITDCGAGGLSSAVGEMGSKLGVDVELSFVPLKYPGLLPWEIWLSEAQERMVLAVPKENMTHLRALCRLYDVEITDIGALTGSQEIIVRHEGTIVLQLHTDFLFHKQPRLSFTLTSPKVPTLKATNTHSNTPIHTTLLNLLAHPNIKSKAAIIRRYDHEVQGGTVVKPLTGAMNDGPSDACVLKPQGTNSLKGIVISNGIRPDLGEHDAYQMAFSVVDEAIRNAVCVGANPDQIFLLDNFCYGNPNKPEVLASLAACAKGCHDAALLYQTPFISGKDSLYNEYQDVSGKHHSIPGTLLISAMGIIPDITKAVTLDFKKPHNLIYLIRASQHTVMHAYRAIHAAMQAQLICACHDLSEGGLAVAIAEMCMAGRLGCHLQFETTDLPHLLFAETDSSLALEVSTQHQSAFEKLLTQHGCFECAQLLGSVTVTPDLVIYNHGHEAMRLSIDSLLKAWQS